ncbi:CoA transferase [Tardiphaga sp.]|uniref:CaiB/BaiF CoA transferase family protein n=1 Tax=Tardiphaga sp. TaxID=1926292 RepID=UPI00262786FA|nr:CoA transferase [Tardiphaga sp.]MDB5619316.1 L-carnitine dehydratase/bile acid-inducible protein [Tardiphaga sp.]
MPSLPLSKLRVVEIGSGDTLDYCGKLFSDFGAEVIKIEPPGGDVARQFAPMVDAGGGRRESGYFAWLNTNKRSITADLDRPEDVARVRALLMQSDLLLDGRSPQSIPASLLTHDALRQEQPGLAITAISWFGEHGPYSNYEATDSVCRALSGNVKLVGPKDGPPVLPRDGQIAVMAGLTAFIPSLAGLYGHATGARRFAVSAQEAMLQISEFDTGLALEIGFTRPRIAINRFGRGYPVGTFPTRDGWLGITVVTPAQWAAFCVMIGMPELEHQPNYADSLLRTTHWPALLEIFQPVLMQQTANYWFERGIELRIPLAVVPDMEELLKQDYYRERGAFAKVEIGAASFDAPVLPQYLTQSRPLPNGVAPFAGEHDGIAFPEHHRTATRAATPDDALPLKGLRIIDLTMGWAGPSATRQMGDLGAEVIKIESCQYPDWFRGTDPRGPYHSERTYEKTYWFQQMNRNKRGITLNLTTETGRTLLKRLLADADAVIDNYAADVLPRMGLGPQAMLKINPRLVVVTMPAFGMTGPWSGVRAYGSTLEQACGLPSVTGREGDAPTMLHAALGDPFGGVSAAAALMLGFVQQRNTGTGQHIDLSAVEALLPLVAPSVIEQSVTGKSGPRIGTRHPRFVPNGCFPCLGEDQWITLAVRSDAEWQALCTVMHRPDLAADPVLATAKGRRTEEDSIEVAVRQWTVTVRPDLAMVTLQAHGIPAGTARLPGDLAGDPHLMQVGHWQPAVRPFMGPHLLPSVAYREGNNPLPYAITRLAPTLGQHNAEVLRELLGLSDAEIEELRTTEIIGDTAVSATKKASAIPAP